MFRFNDSMGSSKVRFFVCAAFLLSFFPLAAEAQLFSGKGLFNRKEEAPIGLTPDQIGVPSPITGRVHAVKGMEIQFELRAQSKTPAAKVEFLIRTFPSAGKITSMTDHPTKRNVAVVTYYADPGSSAESDAFAFAVRYRGGRYSSAMRYDIDLGEVVSEISTDKEVNFGEVAIGTTAEREITVRNLGNGNFQTTLALAPPWYLVDPVDGKLFLGGNGVRKVKVAFRPTLGGETSYFLSFARSKHGTTKLIGKGGEPFHLITEQITMALDPDSGRRVGELVLNNPGIKPVRVLARASTRLGPSMQQEYYLIPGRPTVIDIALQKEDTAPFDGMVQFFLESGLTKTAQVVASVVPGKLEIKIPNSATTELINFGQVRAGELEERSLVLSNSGGVAIPLEFHVPSPFRILNDPGTSLAPMAAVHIGIGLNPPVSSKGPVDVTMNIYGNEQTLPVRLMGNVLKSKRASSSGQGNMPKGLSFGSMRMSSGGAPARQDSGVPGRTVEEEKGEVSSLIGSPNIPSQPVTIIGSQTEVPSFTSPTGEGAIWYDGMTEEQMEALASPLGNLTRPTVSRDVNLQIRRPEDLSILKTGSDSISLAWTGPKNADLYEYEVELSGVLYSDDGVPLHVWAPYENVKISRVDRLVKAEIRNLAPNSTYEFRVFTIDENGRSSAPSDGMHAQTQLPMDWTYIYLVIVILCVILLIMGIIKIKKDRDGEVYQAQFVED